MTDKQDFEDHVWDDELMEALERHPPPSNDNNPQHRDDWALDAVLISPWYWFVLIVVGAIAVIRLL